MRTSKGCEAICLRASVTLVAEDYVAVVAFQRLSRQQDVIFVVIDQENLGVCHWDEPLTQVLT